MRDTDQCPIPPQHLEPTYAMWPTPKAGGGVVTGAVVADTDALPPPLAPRASVWVIACVLPCAQMCRIVTWLCLGHVVHCSDAIRLSRQCELLPPWLPRRGQDIGLRPVLRQPRQGL